MEIVQSRRLSLALLTGLGIAIAIVGFDFFDRMEAMQPRGDSATALSSAQIGEPVKAVLEISKNSAGNPLSGNVLQGVDGSRFRWTRQVLQVSLATTTRFVMGNRVDISPGAVIQVSGTATAPGTVHATQIVILTGYVSVLPESP